MTVPSDIEIAQAAKVSPVTEIAKKLGISEDDLELYGKYNIIMYSECNLCKKK